MIQTITYKNNVLSRLQENEIQALAALAPYWGLLFDADTGSLQPGLSNNSVFIKSENSYEFLHSLLKHTNIQFSNHEEQSNLVIQAFSIKEDHHIPISIHINHVKYHLKYMKNYYKNLQFLIHRSVWLPKRDKNIAITFCHFSLERQMEIIAYLIIQFYMRDEMTSISHISFPIYEKLINHILHPVNSHFAHVQKLLYNSIWPETPPELTKSVHPTSNHSLQNSTFNPFKKNSSISSQHVNPINPFDKRKTTNYDSINPFKKIHRNAKNE